MNRDDDLQARVLHSAGFADTASGPISAIEVHDVSDLTAYIWFADDERQRAASILPTGSARGDALNAAVRWHRRLVAASRDGSTPSEAVLGLRGERSEIPGGGRVGTEVVAFADLEALRGAARSETGSRSGPAPVVDDIDRALAAGGRLDGRIRAEVERIDRVLAERPTPHPVRVWMTLRDALRARALTVGDRHHEPAFLRTRFVTGDTDLDGSADVVELDVPAGVPATWLDGPGVLLLARDLTWVVTDRAEGGHPARGVVLPRAVGDAADG